MQPALEIGGGAVHPLPLMHRLNNGIDRRDLLLSSDSDLCKSIDALEAIPGLVRLASRSLVSSDLSRVAISVSVRDRSQKNRRIEER